jgi:outer membrane protein TolC
VGQAYQENLPLRIAGVRVLEARAQLGFAKGEFFPQTQQAVGLLEYNRLSQRSSQAAGQGARDYLTDQVGLAASWELDLWGKFRRVIESADASLMAAMTDYDSALVSLTADVATLYILHRTLEKRLAIAPRNVKTQQESLEISEARFEGGATSLWDVEQAQTQL